MADDLILKQVLAEIDDRTTAVCLHAAGLIAAVDEPFDTLAGPYYLPPFHIHCRSLAIPYMPGFVNDLRAEANAELQRRPRKQRDTRTAVIPPPPP